MPTHAALFGLDVRLRALQQAKKERLEELSRRTNGNGNARNRHLYPAEEIIQSHRYIDRKKSYFTQGTCHDSVITEKLQEDGLPGNVSYLNYKDLLPKNSDKQIQEKRR